MRLFLTMLVAIATAAHIARAQDSTDTRASRVDSLFEIYNRAPSPGLAVAVVRDGHVLLRRGYGLADLEHRVPITPETVFDVASVSKQFTGLAIATLVTAGKIRLDDDIHRYIPELRDFGHPITIDELVHHTSGIRDWPATLAVAGWSFDDVISPRDILGMACRQRTLNFVPGAEHLYSNTGYNLLAELVQRVSKQSFRKWTDEQIFRPLGMAHTHLRDDYTEVIPDRATGYRRMSDGSYRAIPDNLVAPGSSSIFSTVDDLARWLINFGDERVGGHDALALMRAPGRLNDGTPVPYAFGILGGSYRGLPMFTHSGGWASFDTYTVYLPQQRLGIVVLANSDAIDAQGAVIRIANIYLENDFPAPNVAAASRAERSPASAARLTPAALAADTGLYRFGPGRYARIRKNGTTLSASLTGEKPAALTPDSSGGFTASTGASVVFRRDGAGHVIGLTYDGDAARAVAPRLSPPGAATEYGGQYESAELATRYRISGKGDTLTLWHPRIGTVTLTRLWRDDFGSPLWFMRSVEFQRGAGGRITGLVVNGDPRSRDIRFVRLGAH